MKKRITTLLLAVLVLSTLAARQKPKALRKLVKQGRTDELPPCGYGEPTEGSQVI